MWNRFFKRHAYPPVNSESVSQPSTRAQVYSELNDLVGFQYQLKQRKLNHQQQLLAVSLGNHHATRKGQGMAFSEVRQYQAGDDIRHIDWRVTARTQKTHTKVFVEEHERPTFLITEQTPALFFGSQVRLKTAQVLNIAAVLAWCSLNQNERVGGLCFNDQKSIWVSPRRSQKVVFNFLQQSIQLQKMLTRPGSASTKSWSKTLNQLAKSVRPGAKVFLIGDMINLALQATAELQSLQKHLDIVALHVVDPLEKNLPKLGWLSLTRAFGDAPVALDSFRKKTQQSYAKAYQDNWTQTKKVFSQQQIPLLEIENQKPVIEQLIDKRVII